MKKTFQITAALLLIFVPIQSLWSKNFNTDVQLVVDKALLKDDYALLMPPSNEVTVDVPIGINEVTANHGLNAKRVGNVVYFYLDDSIKRFDLESQSWDSDIDLINSSINAFAVNDSSVLVVHSDNDVYRYDLTGSPAVLLHTSSFIIDELVALNGYVLLVYRFEDSFNTIDAQSGEIAAYQQAHWSIIGVTRQVGTNNVYGRSQGVSPSDIHVVEIDENGQMGFVDDSPYHGDYPNADKVYSFADGSRVVDSSGIVYFTQDLTYAGSFAREVDHLDFFEDLPIIMSGNTLYSYSANVFQTGQFELSESKNTFYIYDGVIYLFKYNTTDIGVQPLAVTELGPLTPGEPVNPVGLAYAIDAVEYNGAESLFLLSRANLAIFKFNASIMAYTKTLVLLNPPLFMSYSQAHNLIYLGYSDGRITTMNPETGEETPFVNIGQTVCGLKSIENHLFVCDPAGAWVSHSIYDASAVKLSSQEWSRRSDEYTWSLENRSLYHFRDDSSPNDLMVREVDANGELGEDYDSPYHGSVSTQYPICVPQTGLYVLLGSGEMYDGITLDLTNDQLPNAIKACAWSKGDLFTLENNSDTYLQSWTAEFVSVNEANWTGEPIELIDLSSGSLVIIFDDQGIPQFRLHRDVIFNNGFD